MTTIQERVTGDHYAATYYGSATGLTNIARSGLSLGTANQVLVNDGTGAISSIAALDTSRGGTGINTSAATGIVRITAGVWSASTILNADVNASAGISRTKLASGVINHVVINDGSGVISSAAQITPGQGGTGVNTSASTGIAKVAGGSWTVGTIIDSDVNAIAGIARTKLASGTNNHVVINNGTGVMTSEAQVATSRGGTGQDFSTVGTGPFIITNTSGVMSSTLQYATSTIANTLIQRDNSGNATVAAITASQTNTETLSSAGNLTIATTGGNIYVGTNNIIQSPATAGGLSGIYTTNIQTTNATPTALFTFATVSNCSYAVDVFVGLCSLATGSTGHFKFSFKVKNVANVLTVSTSLQKASALDSAIVTADVDQVSSGLNFVINVIGVAATTIKWIGTYNLLSQLM